MNGLTQKSPQALRGAQGAALRLGHTEVDVEHFLDRVDGVVRLRVLPKLHRRLAERRPTEVAGQVAS